MQSRELRSSPNSNFKESSPLTIRDLFGPMPLCEKAKEFLCLRSHSHLYVDLSAIQPPLKNVSVD